MTFKEQYNLQKHNTFGVDCYADRFVLIESEADIAALRDLLRPNEQILIVGSGANLLFTKDFHGTVVSVGIDSFELISEDDTNVLVRAGAGMPWHELVKKCTERGLYGLENLALIPGTVGAAPVQNIGAYGSEQKDCFVSVLAADLLTGEISELQRADCHFGYRSSVFKTDSSKQYVNLYVTYRLAKVAKPNIIYQDLKDELARKEVSSPAPMDVFAAVCEVRSRQLPPTEELGSAGSFFKNPIVGLDKYLELAERFGSVPRFPAEGENVKLSAGWLVEQAGWKGKSVGRAGVYQRHALILVNLGGASGAEIDALAKEIEADILHRFSIRLEREVITL
mgnify:CR=1 FL=1